MKKIKKKVLFGGIIGFIISQFITNKKEIDLKIRKENLRKIKMDEAET